MQLGVEVLLKSSSHIKRLSGRRLGLVAHPASVDHGLRHSMDLLAGQRRLKVTCAFGPQHGMRGEKQDNMIESEDFRDPIHDIPVFSLYGEVRRPTPAMLDQLDVILFDLQDVGCRIYTFLTTLFYVLEDCAKAGKSVWVLDRPNPAGRPVEGNKLKPKYFSFVGGAEIPMRHGLTLGEAAKWYVAHKNLDVDLTIVKMTGYKPSVAPGYGWPWLEIPWVNPSPNIPRLSTVRIYPGSVLIEGTKLSEGRGTTRPLEMIGAPGLRSEAVLKRLRKLAPAALFKNVFLRSAFFEPTFQKHKGQLCSGIQIHIDHKKYPHLTFKPYRLVCGLFKAIRQEHPDLDMWLDPPYEYEKINLPIEILSGDSFLKNWVDDPNARWADLEAHLKPDETAWLKERREFLLYR